MVFQNTTDEDSMVVQHILAVRKGRREVKMTPEQKELKTQSEVKLEDKTVLSTHVESKSDTTIKNEFVKDETGDAVYQQGNMCSESSKTGDNITEASDGAKSEHQLDINLSVKGVHSSEVSSNNSFTPHITTVNISEEKSNLKEFPSEEKKTDRIRDLSLAKEETGLRERFKPEQIKPDAQYIEVEEYFVKYRNFSYLHCEWKTEDELFKGDKRISAKLKRFKQKMAHHANIFENVSI